MADLTGMLQAAAGNTGNPNAWDISKAYYDAGSKAWDVSTLRDNSNFYNVNAQDATPSGIFFKPDGTKLYVVGATGLNVYQFDLVAPWILGGSLASPSTDLAYTLDVSANASSPRGLSIKPDGTKFWVLDFGSDTVYQYSMSTAWDLSTATYDSVSFSVTTQETNPLGLFFKPDGTKMYVCGSAGDDVNEYDLSTPWDVSSASYVQNFSVSSQETVPTGLWFRSDGEKMYVTGTSSDLIHEYDLSTPWDVSTATYLQASATLRSASPLGLYIKEEGGQVYYSSNITAPSSFFGIIFETVLGSFSVNAEEAAPEAVFFKPDGTKMYVTGTSGDDVNEYSLSTAWDINTASYVQNFSVATEEAQPTGLSFKPDGTKMYIVGASGDEVNEYDLATAWDVSSASYVQTKSVSAQDTAPTGMFIRDDGAKLYIVGLAGQDVNEYDLPTPWDISTMSYVQNFSVAAQSAAPRGISFKPDGTKMYVQETSAYRPLNEYDLSTPWNISTASFSQAFNVPTGINFRGLYFRENGEQFFLTGPTLDTIQKFSISPE